MRWPWQRNSTNEKLIVSWSGQTLSYVLARVRSDGGYEVLKYGVEHQNADDMGGLIGRLQGLGLKNHDAVVMLRPDQYQLLQIETPAVPPEELRSAARYKIREMLQTHVDDVTLDVMRVGDGQQKGAGHLFVVAVTNALVREIHELGNAMHWAVSIIDIQETAQRNLQNAVASGIGKSDRASAALVLIEGQPVLLTISANEELFYARRFELPEDLLTGSGVGGAAIEGVNSVYTPVDEYVPDYSVDGVSYGTDYSNQSIGSSAERSAASGENEGSQRFLVEVQRSLDLWERSWSSMPLDRVRVYAGERSEELSKWLTQQLGLKVEPMDVKPLFSGFDGKSASDQAMCLPLLGVLLRTVGRKL